MFDRVLSMLLIVLLFQWCFPSQKQLLSLQTHHVYSTLKRHGNGGFHAISTWNTHGVFVEVLSKNVVPKYFKII